MKLLGCGGRDFGMTIDTTAHHPVLRVKPDEIKFLFDKLDDIYYQSGSPGPFDPSKEITEVITGCAPGADFLVAVWAAYHGISVQEFPANWKEQGSAAGPIRNAKQFEEGRPDHGVAFPGGKGTDDMVRILKKNNVPVSDFR